MNKDNRVAFAKLKFQLDNVLLFGNDAAEEEGESLFLSYAVKRTELESFLLPDLSIQVARAYKGEGKSALLRLVNIDLKQSNPGGETLVISTTGPDLSPSIDSLDQDLWLREWKKRILKLVANEIGALINVAFSDDAITLVEEAESNGFRRRSIFSSIFDRFNPTKTLGSELTRTRVTVADYERIVRRYSSGRPLIWLIIDDVDQNFKNDEKSRIKLQTFFTACRQICNNIPELRVRTAIRPNVWTTIKREAEALSHVEQYIKDLRWTKTQFRELLAARVESYLKRTSQWNNVASLLPKEKNSRETLLISLVFEDPMRWGGGNGRRSPEVVLYTLARQRPRWLVELCKGAGGAATQRGSSKICLEDITSQLKDFGRKRLEDLVAEFRSQCTQIEDLLGAFSQQRSLYTTAELNSVIERRVLNAVHPTIIGVTGKVMALDVAHFLFQIGFISARKEYGENDYEHLMYSDNPTLLHSRTNLDDGAKWEIHPVFREYLNLRN